VQAIQAHNHRDRAGQEGRGRLTTAVFHFDDRGEVETAWRQHGLGAISTTAESTSYRIGRARDAGMRFIFCQEPDDFRRALRDNWPWHAFAGWAAIVLVCLVCTVIYRWYRWPHAPVIVVRCTPPSDPVGTRHVVETPQGDGAFCQIEIQSAGYPGPLDVGFELRQPRGAVPGEEPMVILADADLGPGATVSTRQRGIALRVARQSGKAWSCLADFKITNRRGRQTPVAFEFRPAGGVP
jgi:hypothetical protein